MGFELVEGVATGRDGHGSRSNGVGTFDVVRCVADHEQRLVVDRAGTSGQFERARGDDGTIAVSSAKAPSGSYANKS